MLSFQRPATSNASKRLGSSLLRSLSSSSDTDTDLLEIQRIYQLQRSHEHEVARSTVDERKDKLQRMHDVIWSSRDEIHLAMKKDKGNHAAEVDMSDIYPIVHEIKHVKRHLAKWMTPERVSTPLALLGTSSWIYHEPKGVALIMSPWNFPFNLTLGPLISAVAAGNCAMLKPSEMTPHSSALVRKIVAEVFDEKEVAVIEGAVDTSTNLLAQPFNHIFYTGSPMIGKVVMEAASKHLASVTLELGGKSPVIIDETADIDIAAKRLAWAKTTNNGQICIAPDYVYVHESKKDDFIEKYSGWIKTFFGESVQESPYYARIVNGKHHSRLVGVLDEAVEMGAKVEHGGSHDSNNDDFFLEPTVLTNVDTKSSLMTDEIFGPLFPVLTFASLDEPITAINAKEKPLAMYIYSQNDANTERIISSTRAGATCINHSMVHFFNSYLPFGGSNNSGIGKSHGVHGFKGFSNDRAVLKQWSPVSGIDFMTPPYTNLKQRLIDLTMRFF